MATLNNNEVAAIVNAAAAQATGATEVATLDLEGIIDAGNDPSVVGTVDQFTKAMVNVLIDNKYFDGEYISQEANRFYEDSATYGALVQCVEVELPDAEGSSAWKDFTSSSTVGEYRVYIPVVHKQVYGKTNSFQIAITITGEQWDTAFRSASDLAAFVGYVMLRVRSSVELHREQMSRANRNNFIAEKLAYAASDDAAGVHVVNLVKKWAEHIGSTESITVEQFRNNPEALRWTAMQFKLYSDYMSGMTSMFNTAGYDRFTPKDRQILQVLSAFESDMMAVAEADTYHNEIVSLPGHSTVPYWQGSADLKWETISKIDVETGAAGESVSQDGIVALLVDKAAIMHTQFSKRVAVKYFEPENLTNTYYQFRDSYMNNLTMNGLVFILADYTAA